MCVMDSQWVRPQQRACEHYLGSAVHCCGAGLWFAVPAAAAAPCRALEGPSGHGAWIWPLLLQVVQDLSGFVS